MKIVFCWSNISGYMAACWRELSERGVGVHVLAYGNSSETSFNTSLMQGVSWSSLGDDQKADCRYVEQVVAAQEPTTVVIAGWLNPAYQKLVHSRALQACHFVMGMDTPWKGGIRQRLAPFVLRSYLQKISTVWVPGERAWGYARKLGFPANRIEKGLYGIDHKRLRSIYNARTMASWPKRFLFLGRLHAEKGIDLLLRAYEKYATSQKDPWPLTVAGIGPLEKDVSNVAGVEYAGFVQPDDCAELMKKAGVLVLPSRYDPWPLALVEGAAAGLPVLASNRCGSAVEVLRQLHNGLHCDPTIDGIAEGLSFFHGQWGGLPRMGSHGVELSACYSAQKWCDILLRIAK